GGEVGAVVEVVAAQKELVGLAFAGMLRGDHAGHALEELARPQQRPALDVLTGERALAGRVGHADRLFLAAEHLHRRQRAPLLRQASAGGKAQGRSEHEPIHARIGQSVLGQSWSRNRTGTSTQSAMAMVPRRAGTKRHWRTAPSAAWSRIEAP